MHNLAHQNEIRVAIDESHPRRILRLLDQRPLDARVVAAERRIEIEVGFEPRKVSHQLADRDVALAALKLRQIIGDFVRQPQLPVFENLHCPGRRRDHLGQRRQVENRIERHRLALWNQRAASVSLAMQNFSVVPDNQHRSRNQSVAHRLIDHGVERRRTRKRLLRRAQRRARRQQ